MESALAVGDTAIYIPMYIEMPFNHNLNCHCHNIPSVSYDLLVRGHRLVLVFLGCQYDNVRSSPDLRDHHPPSFLGDPAVMITKRSTINHPALV